MCMAVSGTESQMFTDDLNANGNSEMNSVVYRATYCSDSVKCFKTDSAILHSSDEK